jgi:hypothetical protein
MSPNSDAASVVDSAAARPSSRCCSASAILIQIQAPGSLPIDPFFFLIGLTYALTACLHPAAAPHREHRWIVDVQLGCDAVIVSALVYLTGGVVELFHVALHAADHRREHDSVAAHLA